MNPELVALGFLEYVARLRAKGVKKLFPGLKAYRGRMTHNWSKWWVRVFSSNYALYGNMSARANAIYRDFSPRIEIYSIDKSFLDLSDVDVSQRVELAHDLRSTVAAWTGLPTCVGIGPTKTIAKLANHIAKKDPRLVGVCDLLAQRGDQR